MSFCVGSRVQKSVYVANIGRRAPHVHMEVSHRLSNCVNDAPADARVWEKVEINRLATVFDDISPRFGHCPAVRPVAGHTVWDFELDCVSARRKASNAITALLIRSRFNAQRFSLDDQIGEADGQRESFALFRLVIMLVDLAKDSSP